MDLFIVLPDDANLGTDIIDDGLYPVFRQKLSSRPHQWFIENVLVPRGNVTAMNRY
jgi:hypothetical protein